MNGQFPVSRTDPLRPALLIADTPIAPIAYTAYLPRENCYREAAQCGIHLFCFPAYLAGRGINTHSGIHPFRKGIWRDEDEFDMSDLIADMDMILAADPSAKIIMRLHMDVPIWWERKHPDGCCLRRDGSVLRQSFTSPIWRESAGQALRHIVEWIGASPYAPHFVGIHVAAGMTEEWIYHFFDRFEDANPSRLAAFEDFLNAKYPNADTRRAAWCDSTITDPAEALMVLERPGEKVWRDARRDAAVLDALRFHGSALVDAMTGFCRIVKQASDGRLLTGVFYGYHLYIADARKGHDAMSLLLKSPDVDYLASPNNYDRRPGIDWRPMTAVDSVRLHGKVWMAENDTRTSLTRTLAESAPEICPEGPYYRSRIWLGPDSLEVSANLLRTNAARMLTHGYGGWWFDMWGGWFSHPALLAELAGAQKAYEADTFSADSRLVPPGTVCVIADERFADFDASFGALCGPILNQINGLGTIGRPNVVYNRADLPLLDLKHVRLLWLIGAEKLDDTEQAIVQQRLDAGVMVMRSAFTGNRLITGAKHTDRALAAARAIGLEPSPATPLWGGVALDLKPNLVSADLRRMADAAGLHSFLDSDDVFYFGRGYVAIHATTAGEKRIHLPTPGRLVQILPPPAIPGATASTNFHMDQYETRLFHIV